MFDAIVSGGLVVDGTGAVARETDVGIQGDQIVAVGDLEFPDVSDHEFAAEALPLNDPLDLREPRDGRRLDTRVKLQLGSAVLARLMKGF